MKLDFLQKIFAYVISLFVKCKQVWLDYFANKSLKFKIYLGVAAMILVVLTVRAVSQNSEMGITLSNYEATDVLSNPENDEIPQVISQYTSQQFGYEVEYPAWWTHKEFNNGSTVSITDKTGQAVIVIEAKKVSGDENDVLVRSGIVEEALKRNFDYRLKTFQRVEYKGLQAFFADGVFNAPANAWNFQEYELFSSVGVRYTIRVFVERSVARYYDKTVSEILSSLIIK